MRLVVLLLVGVHLAYAGKHSLKYYYTGVSGVIDFPEFTAVGLVDDEPFIYFDSNINKTVPKTEWIRQNEGADYWDRQTQILTGTHPVFKNNIQIAKERFNQSAGVHTVQTMLGCEWDDQTGATNAFKQYGYDGGDFVSLVWKDQRYISPVQQGILTTQKWNNDRGFLESDINYFSTVCIEWLQKYLQYGKSSLQKTVSPQVSLLQKSSSSPVMCHATGFYPSGVTITWMRNGQEHHEDVEVGELLPNEDGTFQKTSTIRVTPEEWKKNKFSCVVEHQGKTMEEDEIRTNPDQTGDSVPIGIIVGVVVAVVLLMVIGVTGYMVNQKKEKLGPNTSTDSATSLLPSDNSSVENTKGPKTCDSLTADRIKSLTSLNSNPDHGYNSGSDNNSCSGSHSGSDSTSDIASVCSDNGS